MMPCPSCLQLRFSESELAAYRALADKANLSLEVWVRETLNYKVGKEQATESHLSIFASHTREYAPGESHCLTTGRTLGKDHNGPCVDRFGGEGTAEIRERNLMVLLEDDPEGFRRMIRELLALERKGE